MAVSGEEEGEGGGGPLYLHPEEADLLAAIDVNRVASR